MGHRITWRTRPRSEYPWIYKTKRVLLADILYGAPFDYELLIGPLDKQAVAEILYRVTEFTADISVTGELGDPPAPATETATTSVILAGSPQPDELQRFVFNRSSDDLTTHDSYPFYVGGVFSNDVFLPVDPMGFGSDPNRDSPVYEDENGNFYLQGYFYFNTTSWQVGNFVSALSADIFPFDATLELASGSYQIKAYAGYDTSISAASATITATAWHPY